MSAMVMFPGESCSFAVSAGGTCRLQKYTAERNFDTGSLRTVMSRTGARCMLQASNRSMPPAAYIASEACSWGTLPQNFPPRHHGTGRSLHGSSLSFEEEEEEEEDDDDDSTFPAAESPPPPS